MEQTLTIRVDFRLPRATAADLLAYVAYRGGLTGPEPPRRAREAIRAHLIAFGLDGCEGWADPLPADTVAAARGIADRVLDRCFPPSAAPAAPHPADGRAYR